MNQKNEFYVVTLRCPTCPRSFRTTPRIAHAKQPTCPECNLRMECSAPEPLEALAARHYA